MERSDLLTPHWQYVSDRVMGGVSDGCLSAETVAGRAATRLTGTVSLENNGGFVQMAFEFDRRIEPSEWRGLAFEVFGNDEHYDIRLRTYGMTRPWQSFRAELHAPARWHAVQLPFTAFRPHRTELVFDPRALRRIGVLGIGRAFRADVAVAGLCFFR